MTAWMITLDEKYCKAILGGRKKIEVRTRIPRTMGAGDAVVVCMKGSKGRVPLFFVVEKIASCSPRLLWRFNHQDLAIDEKDYLEYTEGKKIVHGLGIGYVHRYPRGVTIGDFGVRKAPQWFTEVVL